MDWLKGAANNPGKSVLAMMVGTIVVNLLIFATVIGGTLLAVKYLFF